MSKLKLTNVETGEEYQMAPIEEIDKIGPGTKYIVQIYVGNLPPADVPAFMERAREQIGDFFGDHPDNVLYMPFREAENMCKVFRVE